MLERGLLQRLHRGVYAPGAPNRAPEATWTAALLAAGDESALGRTSAASFYGQLPRRSVIELDHEQTHGTAWASRKDEKRDAWLRGKGKEVWRIRAYGPALAARLCQRVA